MDIDSSYALTQDQISEFRQRGFIKLKSVLTPDVLEYYGQEFGRKVQELNM
jgi:hypothetical protein